MTRSTVRRLWWWCSLKSTRLAIRSGLWENASTASPDTDPRAGKDDGNRSVLSDKNSLALQTSQGAGREDRGAQFLLKNKQVGDWPGNVFAGSERSWLDSRP